MLLSPEERLRARIVRARVARIAPAIPQISRRRWLVRSRPERPPDGGQGTTAPLGAGPSRAGAVGRSGSSFHRTLPPSISKRDAIEASRRLLFLASAPLLAGTFAPAFRASERPIAIACLRLVTFFPERPERSLPLFLSCIARSTFFWALAPYFLATSPPLFAELLTPKQDLRRGTPVASSEIGGIR